jgi:hypothetical protein
MKPTTLFNPDPTPAVSTKRAAGVIAVTVFAAVLSLAIVLAVLARACAGRPRRGIDADTDEAVPFTAAAAAGQRAEAGKTGYSRL